MANKGDPELIFNGVTFSSDPTDENCLQSVSYADTDDELEYLCNNRHVKLPGAATAMCSGTIALASTDVATLAALKTTSIITDFAYYPFGNTTAYISHLSNSAVAFGFTYGEVVNSIVLVDFNIAVNNPVDAAVPV